jgi:glycosyltransferase involved in cell wall biosynthesis
VKGVPRVLFPFVGDQFGGSHLSTLLLIKHLDRNRFEPVIVVHERGPLTEHLDRNGLPYQLLPLSAYPGRRPDALDIVLCAACALPRLRKFLLRERISIVHGNDLRVNLSWLPAARLTRRKFAWHQRAVPTPSRLWSVASLFSDQVICISHRVRNALSGGQRKNVQVIDNPFEFPLKVDRRQARHALATELGTAPDHLYIGFVGRLVRQKRPEIFMRAALAICQTLPQSVVVIAAPRDSVQESGLLAIAAKHVLAFPPQFVGFRNPVEPLLAALDLLLVPAVEDGFGRTLVESGAVGTPVVASESGGHVESNHAGVELVGVNDWEAMAAAGMRIAGAPDETARRTERAKAEVRARYSATAHAHAIMSIYDDIAAMRQPDRQQELVL